MSGLLDRFPNLPAERRTYAAMLAAVDDAVGAVMRTLDEYHLTENTFVVFTSDNGATRARGIGYKG